MTALLFQVSDPRMDVTKREINAATANVSSLLTRYSKLASQVTTSYSSSGKLADDTNVRRDELEDEVNAALDNVRSSAFCKFAVCYLYPESVYPV